MEADSRAERTGRGACGLVGGGDSFERIQAFDLKEPVVVTSAVNEMTFYFRAEMNRRSKRKE